MIVAHKNNTATFSILTTTYSVNGIHAKLDADSAIIDVNPMTMVSSGKARLLLSTRTVAIIKTARTIGREPRIRIEKTVAIGARRANNRIIQAVVHTSPLDSPAFRTRLPNVTKMLLRPRHWPDVRLILLVPSERSKIRRTAHLARCAAPAVDTVLRTRHCRGKASFRSVEFEITLGRAWHVGSRLAAAHGAVCSVIDGVAPTIYRL